MDIVLVEERIKRHVVWSIFPGLTGTPLKRENESQANMMDRVDTHGRPVARFRPLLLFVPTADFERFGWEHHG